MPSTTFSTPDDVSLSNASKIQADPLVKRITQAYRKKETALKEAHQTLLAVLDSIDAFIYVADIETNETIFMNRRMRQIHREDELSKPCWQIFTDQDGPCKCCSSGQLLDDKGNPKETIIWEEHDPRENKWYLHRSRAVKWSDGRFVQLHMITDISAVKMLEQERLQSETRLRQAQKMEAIGTLAGGIAHDFNNILSAILGYSDMALDDANQGIATPKYISQVLKAGQRAKELVQQILTYTRQTEAGAQPIQIQPIVKEALKLLRASLPSTIEITNHIRSAAMIQADPVQIHQVIVNLCTNAGHAMRNSGGQLTVTIEEAYLAADAANSGSDMLPERYLKIEVSDTGEGIAPEIKDKIFDPYFTTKQMGQGTGLGLSVVQGIVHSYNGHISVASKVEKGTIFTIHIPIIEPEDDGQTMVMETVPLGNNEHILFVDDETPLTDLGKELLERLGYRVTTCNDSLEALALFEQQSHDIDLVITDLTMPNMTGEVLAEKIRAIKPEIPILICTGYSRKVTQAMLDRLGIRDIIIKPIIREELAYMIRKNLQTISK